MASLFSNFLAALGVPHTESFSSRAFAAMTFKSVFGLTKLLQSYGIDSETLRFSDKAEGYSDLPVPFLAQLDGCFAIVSDKTPDTVTFSTLTDPPGSTMSRKDFLDRWTGVALIAYPTPASREPDLAAHRRTELLRSVLKPAMALSAAILLLGLGFYGGLFAHVATALLLAFNLIGAYVSFMLVQKSAGIHTTHADKVCSIIERTGCNTVLATSASKLCGAVSWSAVGMGYFSVNIIALLLAPESIHALALLNICCLPFSFWSVWYQRQRAGAWCTLCLIVQATLWAIFFTNLLGHLIAWPPVEGHLLLLLCAYVLVTLAVNALTDRIARLRNARTQ